MMQARKISTPPYFLYLLASLCSAFLTFWIGTRQTAINPDAICYLLSADAMANGIKNAMQLCTQAAWPFYALLLHVINQATHLSVAHTAILINGIFSISSVILFLQIVKTLGANKRTLYCAALVILLAHSFNNTREYIIRDHGYWALYLASLFCLINLLKTKRWIYSILWNVSILSASLFRVEGICFLLAVPFLMLFYRPFSLKLRIKNYFLLQSISIIFAFIFVIFLLNNQHISSQNLGRLTDFLNQFQHGFSYLTHNFRLAKQALITHVLPQFAERDAGFLLFCVLVIWYLMTVISNLGLAYTGLFIYGVSKKILPKDDSQYALWIYIGINVFVTFLFLAEALFLSNRYVMGLVLVLMIWVPFALNQVLNHLSQRKYQLAFSVILFTFILSTLSALHEFGRSKNYVRQAGIWLSSVVPQDAKLFSNDIQLMYHSQHYGLEIFKYDDEFQKLDLKKNAASLAQFQYIALKTMAHDDIKLMESKQFKLLKTFANKQGDRVDIYAVTKEM